MATATVKNFLKLRLHAFNDVGLQIVLDKNNQSKTTCDFRSIGSGMGVADGAGVALATSGTAGTATGVRALQAAKTKESERRAMNKRMSFR